MGISPGRSAPRLATALLILASSAFASAAGGQNRVATIEAHRVGAVVTTIIEFGDQYLGGDELYDAKITVLDLARGEKAWDAIKEASASNPAPKAGFEYLLAHVRFEFSARTSPSHYIYHLNETQFAATTPDGQEFDAPSLAETPNPTLAGALRPGDSLEGSLIFLVPRNVSKPLMMFREDVGTVSHRGGGTWFELYRRAMKPSP